MLFSVTSPIGEVLQVVDGDVDEWRLSWFVMMVVDGIDDEMMLMVMMVLMMK